MSDIIYKFFEASIPEKSRGFAERYIQNKLEKSGCIVWRGGYLYASEKPNQWPVVVQKYQKALKLLDSHGHDVYRLQQLCRGHKGMPDFLVYNHTEFYFVECKLEHEQLSSRQKQCIEHLEKIGMKTYVYKVCAQAKGRTWVKNTQTGKKTVLEEQKRILKHY